MHTETVSVRFQVRFEEIHSVSMSLFDLAQSAENTIEVVKRAMEDLQNAASCETAGDMQANLESAKAALRESLDDVQALLKIVARHKPTNPFRFGDSVRVKKTPERQSVVIDSYFKNQGYRIVLGDGGHFGADELEPVS